MRLLLLMLFAHFSLSTLAQEQFVLKGYGEKYKDGDKIFLSYKKGQQWTNDSVLVKNKTFIFSGTVSAPIKASVYRNQNPQFANIVYDHVNVYLEKGTIHLKSPDTLKHSIPSGTPVNEDFAQLNVLLMPFLDQLSAMQDPTEISEEKKKDSAYVSRVTREYLSVLKEMDEAKFKFIAQKPSSLVSLVALNELVKNTKWLKRVEEAYLKLPVALKASGMGKFVEQSINLGKKISVGMQAPNFSQPDTLGKIHQLADYKGKYVLLDFWASWCGPCRAENPNVLAAYQQYKSKNFMVLSVSIDEAKDRDKWLKAIREDQLIWPQLSDLKGSQNAAHKLYGITTIPANLLISPEGKVLAKDLKGELLHATLKELLK
ncbi:TlpA disulfide reductase family protein [Pedobacter sp.]|uniref:TlpA disulfide reductase family protein n=1 Tax=Pedobacter sp. TaxID=1411316 RepID=UPI0031DCD2EA